MKRTRKTVRPSPDTRAEPRPPPEGLAARDAAARMVEEVLRSGRALDDIVPEFTAGLDGRDRGFARAVATATFRRLGSLRLALADRMKRGAPGQGSRLEIVMLTGAAQILLMDTPDHAAVDSSVELLAGQTATAGYRGLVNAVLRRIVRERDEILAGMDPLLMDTPDWLAERWIATYGEDTARLIAATNATEPPLDLAVKADAPTWAERLDGILLPTGGIRLRTRTAIDELSGYDEGAWWVQDAAASVPAQLLAARPGERVADLCAAPGGKTAQVCAAGAEVTAVDRSAPRLKRLRENLTRLGLEATVVTADAATWPAPPFDAVLLDAPCSATGTIRRHPDVAWTKSEGDVTKLAALQARLLAHAIDLVKPGGRLVYCTCSLERDEGETQVERLLAARTDVRLDPIRPDEVGGIADWITPSGEWRALPHHLPGESPRLSGSAGFYAARLIKL